MSRKLSIATILGARPQFIKAAPVVHRLKALGHAETIIHTGQHYDSTMSDVFFQELDIPQPAYNLGVGSGLHGATTGAMMTGIEAILIDHRPDWVLVYGDTNSTLAAALVACKLRIPLAHVESGLRSFNRAMPEEHNRVIADHVADLLCCPTETAVTNLAREGITAGVHLTGDTMVDGLLATRKRAASESNVLSRLGLTPRGYILATLHRPYLTDEPKVLEGVLKALGGLSEPVVFPCHPRTRARIAEAGLKPGAALRIIEPVGYIDMVELMAHARIVVTDSGGIQKETFVLGTPCVTARPETEWVETVAHGWNRVVGHDPQRLLHAIATGGWPDGTPPAVFGDGGAARHIVDLIEAAN